MMSVVNFAGPPQLRLFQCEGFGNLGGLKPNKQKGFFTADDVNNVLIPANQSISGLIKIETAGRYRVFYRTTRRNKIVPAEILIDNRLLSGSENLLGSNFAQQTLFSGEVDLTAGGHSIVVRPKNGESIRADFIILTTDKNIGGYAFDAPADKP